MRFCFLVFCGVRNGGWCRVGGICGWSEIAKLRLLVLVRMGTGCCLVPGPSILVPIDDLKSSHDFVGQVMEPASPISANRLVLISGKRVKVEEHLKTDMCIMNSGCLKGLIRITDVANHGNTIHKNPIASRCAHFKRNPTCCCLSWLDCFRQSFL